MRFSMILGSVLLLAGLTAACQPIQPEAPAVAEPMGTVPMLPEVITAPTTASTIFVLPDGTTCTFAGTGEHWLLTASASITTAPTPPRPFLVSWAIRCRMSTAAWVCGQ